MMSLSFKNFGFQCQTLNFLYFHQLLETSSVLNSEKGSPALKLDMILHGPVVLILCTFYTHTNLKLHAYLQEHRTLLVPEYLN